MCALLRSLLALLASLLALLRSLIALLRSLLALLACSAPVAAGNSHKALAYFSRLQVAFLTHLLDVRICTLVPVSEYFCTSKTSAFLTHLLDVSICTFVPVSEYFCTSKASAFLTHLLDACTPSVYQQKPRQRRLKKKRKLKKKREPACTSSSRVSDDCHAPPQVSAFVLLYQHQYSSICTSTAGIITGAPGK